MWKPKVMICAHSGRLVLLLSPESSSLMDMFIASDPGVKSDIWDGEIHYTGLHTLKVIFHWRSVCTQLSPHTVQISVHEHAEERHLLMVWAGQVKPNLPPCAVSLSRSKTGLVWWLKELLSSVLHCSPGLCNLLSAWPDYCLLHIVSSLGMEGWRRERTDLSLHKQDYLLLMYPSGSISDIFGCLSSLFVWSRDSQTSEMWHMWYVSVTVLFPWSCGKLVNLTVIILWLEIISVLHSL